MSNTSGNHRMQTLRRGTSGVLIGLTVIASGCTAASRPDAVAPVSPSAGSGTTDPADDRPLLEQLDGRSFRMVSTFTDAGGIDTMTPGLGFRITFSGSSATVAGDCPMRYSRLRHHAQAADMGDGIDFGNPA